MKKLIASLLLIVLVVPGLAWAEEAKEKKYPWPHNGPHSKQGAAAIERIDGKLVSLSANTVTIAALEESKDAKTVVVHISDKPELRGLLAKGLGQKVQLICRETDKEGFVLVRVKSIGGVEVPKQGGPWLGMKGKMHHRGKDLSPEQREKMKKRFKTMHEHIGKRPELRKELRELAQKDPEAFRRRIREIHERAGKSGKDGGHYSKRSGWSKHKGKKHGGKSFGQWHDPQIRKMRQEAHELAKKYSQAQGQDKERLGRKLREKLAETFDKRIELQAKAAKGLERRLEELKQDLEKRRESRDVVIEKYFAKMTEQKDKLPK